MRSSYEARKDRELLKIVKNGQFEEDIFWVHI